MNVTQNSNFSVHNQVLLEQSHLFVYMLYMAASEQHR